MQLNIDPVIFYIAGFPILRWYSLAYICGFLSAYFIFKKLNDFLSKEQVESIFNYGFDIADEAFKKAGVPFISLTNYASLIDLAVEKGDVDANTQDMLMEWRNSPATWKQ